MDTQTGTQPDRNSGGMTIADAGAAIGKIFEQNSGGPRDDQGRYKSTQEASPAPQPQPVPSQEEAAPIETESGAEDATEEVDIEIDDGESTGAEQQPDIEMPKSWSSTDRDEWSKLTPEAKKIVLRREMQREAGMNKLASQLKAKEAEVAKALEEMSNERRQLASQAQRYAHDAVRKFQADFGDVKDIGHLAATDPAKFIRYQAAQAQVAAAVQEAHTFEQQQAEEFNRSMVEFRQAENEKLADKLKLDTPEKKQVFEQRIVKAADAMGIPTMRLAQYTAVELEMFDKALKWDAAVAKRKSVEQQPKQPPKIVKPGTQSQMSSKEQQEVALMKNLRKTGTIADAAAVFKTRLGGR